MSDSSGNRPAASGVLRAYWRLAGGFWSGPTGLGAWTLTFVIFALVLGNIVVQYGLNLWNRAFFNALGRQDTSFAYDAIVLFAGLAFMVALVAVLLVVYRFRLQVLWRQWLSRRLAVRWLEDKRYYRLSIAAPELDSPEQRIAEDAKVATLPVIDFACGIVGSVVTAVVFVGVLWTAAGTADIFGHLVPGYLVYAAIAYAAIMSGTMLLGGRALIGRVEHRNVAEAQLRYELTRVRTNAESIAMVGGAEDEVQGLIASMQRVADAWRSVVRRNAWLTWLTGGNGVMAPVLPLLLAAPNYFSGQITLGALTQSAAAFVQVQVALNWLVDNYSAIAEWMASVRRVTALWSAFEILDESVDGAHGGHISIEESADADIYLKSLAVSHFDGTSMIDDATTVIASREKVLLMGDSGTGKSTLIRAIAGLWPWGSGTVQMPVDAKVAFLPQRPYMPLGTLRQVLHYPANEDERPNDVLEAALKRCGMAHLIRRLDEVDQWESILSGGELQRIGFARLLVMQPDIAILDEATAALDTASQASMMELFQNELAHVTLISVGHRAELADFHDRKLTLQRKATRVSLAGEVANRPKRRLGSLISRIRRRPITTGGSGPDGKPG
jgi:putative ATP-binding cassette transporter